MAKENRINTDVIHMSYKNVMTTEGYISSQNFSFLNLSVVFLVRFLR